MTKNIALTVSLLIGTAAAFAGDIQPLMVQRGALLLDESFAGGLDTNRWTVAIGEWRVENGVLAGTERPADQHAAVIKTPFTNIVFLFADDWGWDDLSCHGQPRRVAPAHQ